MSQTRWTTILALAVGLSAGTGCAAKPAATKAPTAAREAPHVMQPETPPAASSAPAEVSRERDDAPHTLPTACSGAGELCVPPSAFVKRMCKTSTPDLALTMFHQKSPWTRAYVRADMEAWYASAGRSEPQQLRHAEEVIVVADRSAQKDGGVQVSGAGSYDVYRFDGSCVSLMADEVSLRRPSNPDVAPLRWKRLDDDIRTSLTQDQRISHRYTQHQDACKGGDQRRCERANVSLSRMVADYVRAGGEVPQPKLIP